MLTYGEAARLLDYNPDTGELRWKVGGGGIRRKDKAGCQRKDGYLVVGARGKSYLAHRLAWLLYYGEWPKDQIDHINHNRSDNRITNLREATNQHNQRNLSLQSNNSSGICGVSWSKPRNKWTAQIWINGTNRGLGYFDTMEEAAAARLTANKQHGYHENHGL